MYLIIVNCRSVTKYIDKKICRNVYSRKKITIQELQLAKIPDKNNSLHTKKLNAHALNTKKQSTLLTFFSQTEIFFCLILATINKLIIMPGTFRCTAIICKSRKKELHDCDKNMFLQYSSSIVNLLNGIRQCIYFWYNK